MEERVEFLYPEGFQEAVNWLHFLEEDQREGFLLSVLPEIVYI